MFFQFGTFIKAASLSNTLSFAEDALARSNFQVFVNAQQGGFQQGGFFVIGGNAQVIVTISCAPQDGGTFVAVTAASENSTAAELARNQVRQLIQEEVLFD
jgi:hypothetical protein